MLEQRLAYCARRALTGRRNSRVVLELQYDGGSGYLVMRLGLHRAVCQTERDTETARHPVDVGRYCRRNNDGDDGRFSGKSYDRCCKVARRL